MPINFGILNQQPQSMGKVTQLQAGQDQGSSIGSLLEGLGSLLGAIKRKPASDQGTANINPNYANMTPDQMNQQPRLEQLIQQNSPGGTMSDPSNPLSLEAIAKAALNAYPDNPSLAKLTASQAVLESGLIGGNPSGLAKHNNLFGIKGTGTSGAVSMPTTEYINGQKTKVNADFAANKSIDDSFKQHAELLKKPRYNSVLTAPTFEDAARDVQKSGYATDPNYSNLLMNVFNKHLAKYF